MVSVLFLALTKQKSEYNDTYRDTLPVKKGKVKNAIKTCLQASKRAIKWRMAYVTSFLICVLYFAICQACIPSLADFLIMITIVYICIYGMLYYFDSYISSEIYEHGMKNLKHLSEKSERDLQK